MNINAELAHTRTLVLEIESFAKKAKKSDNEIKAIKEWKSELTDRINMHLIENLNGLSDSEKEMAKNYFYRGFNWSKAYAKSPLYNEDEKVMITSESPMETHRKQIVRIIKKSIIL